MTTAQSYAAIACEACLAAALVAGGLFLWLGRR